MITRIELINYMSHKHTVIEPAAGLTVLVGPNNCGKSAVADALRTVCGFNHREGAYMVRHGETTSSVSVTTSEGSTVTWMRKKGTVSWQVDGRDIHRDMPEDLQEKLRLPMVVAEGRGQEFSVHLADQKQPLFLLGMPPSAPALFFAASSDARHLISMRQAHKKRVQGLESRRKGLEDELGRLGKLVDTLEPVPILEDQLCQAEAAFEQIQKGNILATRLEGDWENLGKVQAERDGLRPRTSALAPLEPPPSLEDPTPLDHLGQALAGVLQEISFLSQQQTSVQPLARPPELLPAPDLEALIQALRGEGEFCLHLEGAHRVLDALLPPTEIEDPTSLEGILRDLGEWTHLRNQTSRQVDALKGLITPPEVAADDPLAILLGHLRLQKKEAAHLHQGFSAMETLAPPPSQTDAEPLQNLIARIQEGESEFQGVQKQTNILGSLQNHPELSDPTSMVLLLKDLGEAAQNVLTCQNDVGTSGVDIQALASEIQAWLETHGSCPACGHVLSEGVITGGGLHGH